MTKSFFLLPLALCLLFQSHYAAAQGAIQSAAKDSLIKTACQATSSPPLCSSALSAIANSPYLNPTNIAITAVQAATKTSIATFDLINMSLTVDVQIVSDPTVKQSLAVCATEYKNVIDNMNNATSALTQNNTPQQVPTYLNAALSSASKCQTSGMKNTNRVVQIASKNMDCTKLIKNALEIYQVFANYIINPSHDPKKPGASVGPLGGGGPGPLGGGGPGPLVGGGAGPLGGGGAGLLKGGGAGGAGLLGGGGAGPLGGGGAGLLGGGAAAAAGGAAAGGGAAAAGGGVAAGGQISNRKLLTTMY